MYAVLTFSVWAVVLWAIMAWLKKSTTWAGVVRLVVGFVLSVVIVVIGGFLIGYIGG
jgi:hypothetical protein